MINQRTSSDLSARGYPLGEQRVLLQNVRWTTYEQLLADLTSQSSPRLTYNRGTLEIMTPLPPHERLTYIIEMLVSIYASETGTDVYCLRSTTFKREDLERGFEPDSCFYVQNEARVRGKDTINLRVDPAPDLVIEIDITSGSINKFPIYAQLGVSEIWRHDGSELTIYVLAEQSYTQASNSLAFPSVNGADVSEFIRHTKDLPSTDFLKRLHEWVAGLIGG